MQLLQLYHALQLNGMLMMRKIQQAMQDDAIRATTIHPTFILITGLKFSYGKISSPLTEIPGWKNAISCVFRRKFCAIISCLFYWFYPFVVLLVRSSVRKKGSETVTPWRMLQGRDVYPSDGQTPLQLLLVCFFPAGFSRTHAGRMHVRMGQALLESIQYDGSPCEDT